MTDTVRTILKRVLNQECDNQNIWMEKDKQNGFDGAERLNYINELHSFMDENNIPIEPWIHS